MPVPHEDPNRTATGAPPAGEAPTRPTAVPSTPTPPDGGQSTEVVEPTADPAPGTVGRYQLGEVLARGGMGVVYRADDPSMPREVAVKLIDERLRADPLAVSRFLAEARITGQLQHPGIPPVFEVGQLPDGSPFLAMKLIKGNTLEDLLTDRPDPSQDRGRFVAVFEQIAQAVGYAHAHKVIHRDLKPANVMVGAFGEVQVMDWGIAKVLTETQPSTLGPDDATIGTAIRSLRDSSDMTRAGSAMGTPQYMPREQAIGAVDQMDERSDVFGLGGILCAILTGQPPYSVAGAEAARQMAAVGKLDDAFARLSACGAEPELVALCKRCLSPEKSDRPKDAGEVARAVAELRAAAEQRARQAELDRVRATEQRKRARVQLALGGSLLLVVVVSGVGAWWVQREAGMREAERLQRKLDDERRDAVAAHEASQREMEENRRKQVERDRKACLAYLQLASDLEGRGEWDKAIAAYRDAIKLDPQYVAPHNSLGLVLQRKKDLAGAIVEFREAIRLDPSFASAHRNLGFALAERQDWDGVIAEAGHLIRLNPSDSEAYGQLGFALRQKGNFAGAIAAYMKTTELSPSSARARLALGDALTVTKDFEGAIAAYQHAFRLDPTWVPTHKALERALRAKGDVIGTIAFYREAIRLNPEHPDVAWWYQAMGGALKTSGDLNGALKAYEESCKHNPTNATARTLLGGVRAALGDLDGAIADHRMALKIKPDLFLAHFMLGSALRQKGDVKGAIVAYEEAIRYDQKFAASHHGLGSALVDNGDLDRGSRLSGRRSDWIPSTRASGNHWTMPSSARPSATGRLPRCRGR